MRILRSLAVVAIAGWLGIMAFFSFGVAPLVFRTIDRAVAGQAVAAVLPRYYDWGLVLCGMAVVACVVQVLSGREGRARPLIGGALCGRSEEHTSELQSRLQLGCRLLLEKKKNRTRPMKRFLNFIIRGGREEEVKRLSPLNVPGPQQTPGHVFNETRMAAAVCYCGRRDVA